MQGPNYLKKIKTPDGTIISTYIEEEGMPGKLHSMTGPAIKYPKAQKKKDVYAIYGREMTKKEWLILKNDAKVITPLPERV